MTSDYNPPSPERLAEAKKRWAQVEARRAEYRRDHPVQDSKVFCPFSSDGKCGGGCTDNRERACVNGED